MTQKFAQPAEAEFKGSIPIIYKEKKIGENPFNMFNIDKRMMKWVSHKKNDGCQS